MSFKKNKQKYQPNLFTTASFSLPECERRYMEGDLPWHNEFYRDHLPELLSDKEQQDTLQALGCRAWINLHRLFLFDVNTANLALQKA